MIFCQMVDDTSAVTEEFPTEEDPEKERLRLFAIDRELATCENTTNELVLARAREEIKWSLWRVCADTEKEMQSRYHQELELLALGELHLALGSVQRRKCWWRCPPAGWPQGASGEGAGARSGVAPGLRRLLLELGLTQHSGGNSLQIPDDWPLPSGPKARRGWRYCQGGRSSSVAPHRPSGGPD